MKHNSNYKPKDFAELLHVSVKTLQRWDRDGILVAKRTPTDRRYYTYDQYLDFKGINDCDENLKVIYTRVSANNQKDDLINQIKFLQEFCNAKGIIIDKVIEDIGSRLNYNRNKWNKLIEMCMENKIDSIYVTLVQDIISILHVFSCKIYGMRKYKKKIEEEEDLAKSIQSGIETNEATDTKD